MPGRCKACEAMEQGIKTKQPLQHIGCEFDKVHYNLRSVPGHASFIGQPSNGLIQAVEQIALLAFTELKNQ